MFFKDNPSKIGVSFGVFNEDQLNGMGKEFYPDFISMESVLSCDYPINPRHIWLSLRKLKQDEITSIFRELKIIISWVACRFHQIKNN